MFRRVLNGAVSVGGRIADMVEKRPLMAATAIGGSFVGGRYYENMKVEKVDKIKPAEIRRVKNKMSVRVKDNKLSLSQKDLNQKDVIVKEKDVTDTMMMVGCGFVVGVGIGSLVTWYFKK